MVLVLYVIALMFFILAAVPSLASPRLNFVPAGLAAWVLAQLFAVLQ